MTTPWLQCTKWELLGRRILALALIVTSKSLSRPVPWCLDLYLFLACFSASSSFYIALTLLLGMRNAHISVRKCGTARLGVHPDGRRAERQPMANHSGISALCRVCRTVGSEVYL
eukprot:233974-Pleurochrysis_carterae.AAC.2